MSSDIRKQIVLSAPLYTLALILASLLVCFIAAKQPRRRDGEPFDWTHRRRWWRPRWASPTIADLQRTPRRDPGITPCYTGAWPSFGSHERQEYVLILLAGSCVTHARMPELGSGEILGSEDGKIRIRFASGDKSFLLERAAEHLKITSEAPVLPPAKPARRATKRKTKA